MIAGEALRAAALQTLGEAQRRVVASLQHAVVGVAVRGAVITTYSLVRSRARDMAT